jgi:hypothetical protein
LAWHLVWSRGSTRPGGRGILRRCNRRLVCTRNPRSVESLRTHRESNWLPAPDGPIYVVMRLYWLKEEALKGEWKPPEVKRVE